MAYLEDQPTASPTRKVAATGIAGAVTVVLVYLIQAIFSIVIPAEVAAALTLIISFASGYIVKESA